MALSNWDLLAFNTKAESCDGVFNYKGTSVEIYKNWAHIMNEKMWQDGHGFIEPILGTINQGDLHIGGITIIAERHEEQNSIFIVCVGGYTDEKEIMVGIGCSGYINEARIYVEKLKVDTENYDWTTGSTLVDGEWSTQLIGFPVNIDDMDRYPMQEIKIPAEIKIPDDQLYVGVTETTYKAFIEFLDREVDNNNLTKEYVNKIKESNTALHFNQGDKYIVEVLEGDGAPIPASKLGENPAPVLMQHIAAMKKE